jgi:hypothetical protein
MPNFPDRGQILLPQQDSIHKEAYKHRTSSDHLVLTRKKPDISWLEQISNHESWSEEEKKAFIFSQFYLRRLLYVISPNSFPSVSYIDDKHLVVKKVEGNLSSFWQLSKAEQEAFRHQLSQLGIDEKILQKKTMKWGLCLLLLGSTKMLLIKLHFLVTLHLRIMVYLKLREN